VKREEEKDLGSLNLRSRRKKGMVGGGIRKIGKMGTTDAMSEKIIFPDSSSREEKGKSKTTTTTL